MTNTDTADADATAAQVAALAEAGSQLVRITVNNDEAAAAVPEIAARLADMGVSVPLIGDFHYNGHLLLANVSRHARGRSPSIESIPATSAASGATKTSASSPGSRRRMESRFASE